MKTIKKTACRAMRQAVLQYIIYDVAQKRDDIHSTERSLCHHQFFCTVIIFFSFIILMQRNFVSLNYSNFLPIFLKNYSSSSSSSDHLYCFGLSPTDSTIFASSSGCSSLFRALTMILKYQELPKSNK